MQLQNCPNAFSPQPPRALSLCPDCRVMDAIPTATKAPAMIARTESRASRAALRALCRIPDAQAQLTSPGESRIVNRLVGAQRRTNNVLPHLCSSNKGRKPSARRPAATSSRCEEIGAQSALVSAMPARSCRTGPAERALVRRTEFLHSSRLGRCHNQIVVIVIGCLIPIDLPLRPVVSCRSPGMAP
jgi:hypothetical protein